MPKWHFALTQGVSVNKHSCDQKKMQGRMTYRVSGTNRFL